MTDDRPLQQKVKILARHQLDAKTSQHLEEILHHFLKSYQEKFGPQSLRDLSINIKEMNTEGRRVEYELHANLLTASGDFHATKTGWDLPKEFERLLSAIKKQLHS